MTDRASQGIPHREIFARFADRFDQSLILQAKHRQKARIRLVDSAV